jgi:hypothetical protein
LRRELHLYAFVPCTGTTLSLIDLRILLTFQVELASLHERKTLLLQVNVAVHRFLTDSGHPAGVLKDDVADLYRVWDETFQR